MKPGEQLSAQPRSFHARLPRPRLPGSLRAQMAIGSALIALAAVLFVSLATVLAVTASFNGFQRTQLSTDAAQIASALGADQHSALNAGAVASTRVIFTHVPGDQRLGNAYIWVMDRHEALLTAPAAAAIPGTGFAQDQAALLPALREALAGHASSGTLPGTRPLFLADRLYAVAPVYANGKSGGAIIGAVALSSPQRSERTGAFRFVGDVNSAVLISVVAVAILAALAAILFSLRLTRPLASLGAAALNMASGDYAVRVKIASPEEYRQLGDSFNTMAAALERDVAELHAQEQLRRQLVADVAHELATPLTAIEGFTEALLEGVVHDSAAREETARTIAREAARLHRLVDQLRQVALYESGIRKLERAPLRLPALVEETLDVLAPELEQRRITVAQSLPADLPPVLADSDRLTEILLNLLDNALHHTPPEGSIGVSAAVEQGMVRMSVEDSGPGIAPGERQRIFERFHRTDRSRSTATGGSGLGLAIVKALVEAHGGRVWADERPEGGARFNFTLPVA